MQNIRALGIRHAPTTKGLPSRIGWPAEGFVADLLFHGAASAERLAQ